MKRLLLVPAIHWILRARILCVCLLLGAAVWTAAEPIASLRATNYVNDFAGALDAATETRLNDLCRQVDQKAQAQIAVVTVKSRRAGRGELRGSAVSEVGNRSQGERSRGADPAGDC